MFIYLFEILPRPDTPFALLRQSGWEALDPFVPVEVKPFDDGETGDIFKKYIYMKIKKLSGTLADVMIDYYADKGYLREGATRYERTV